jgi:hypothetical protein
VDGHVVGLVALDDLLRLLFGSVPLVAFESEFGNHFFLDRSSDPTSFRVPLDMVATLEVRCHWE